LSGRTKSDLYEDVANSIFKCYHLLRYEDATYKKLFYNKKATLTRLHSAKIKYADGTTSTKIAIFDGGSLLDNGPLSPIVKYLEHNKKVEQEKTRKEEEKKKRELEEAAIQKKREEEAEERRKCEVTGPLGTTYLQKYDYEPQKVAPQEEKDEVYTSAAHMPSFPGGDGALMKYIESNIKYPLSAKDNNIQGKVVVQFVVTKNGKVGDVKVVKSVDKDLDNEAIRLTKTLPTFSPGRNKAGEPVDVWYTLPLTFKLPSTY
jgi:protein TonB